MKCWLGLECLQLDAGGGRGFVLGVVKDVCVCVRVCVVNGGCAWCGRVWSCGKRDLRWRKGEKQQKRGKKTWGKGLLAEKQEWLSSSTGSNLTSSFRLLVDANGE